MNDNLCDIIRQKFSILNLPFTLLNVTVGNDVT